MRKVLSIAVICIMVITVFSGCGVLQKLGFQKNNDELYPVSSIVMSEDEAKKLTDKVPIHLYFASEDDTKLKLEVRYIPASEANKSVSNKASIIVKELIKGPAPESGLKPTIPATAALRGPVTISAGVATVDFTKDFVDKHPGGKTAEQLTIYSIVNSLTELKEIEKVRFLINGKTQKDFKGNFQFDTTFQRSTAIISKLVPPAGSSGTDTTKSPTKQDGNTGKTDSTPKPSGSAPTPTIKPDQSLSNADEDSEETYLEILE